MKGNASQKLSLVIQEMFPKLFPCVYVQECVLSYALVEMQILSVGESNFMVMILARSAILFSSKLLSIQHIKEVHIPSFVRLKQKIISIDLIKARRTK